LGRSIGINNIPAKTCTYSCVYCQLGRTNNLIAERRKFYEPKEIFAKAKKQVEVAQSNQETIDYLTFVPDGEATLESNLQAEIDLVKQLNVPLAILTNSSFIDHENVRAALSDLDVVSLKIDAVSKRIWRKVNRPHGALKLNKILEGINEFSEEYEGTLITETMLIDGIDYSDELEKIGTFLADLNVSKAYIAIPTRPPAEDWVRPATEEVLNKAFCIFSEKLGDEGAELLIGYEGNLFSSTGDLENDLLGITAVHPMREEAVKRLVEKTDSTWDAVEAMLVGNQLVRLQYESEVYYMRRLPSRT
jgi:wyosine [tRNA(Phe)-imidazoG37] synthetase (radical SAM superfamily)